MRGVCWINENTMDMTSQKSLATLADPDELYDALVARSGLGEFADEALRARFVSTMDVLAAGIFTDHRDAAVRQIENILKTRLELARDWATYPDIAQESIERPIFVVGYARTGTTVMHSLLGEDPNSRIPQAWQSWRPSPPPGLAPDTIPQRILETDAEVRAFLAKAPEILKPHPYWDRYGRAPVEDEELFSLDFLYPYPTHYFDIPVRPASFDVPDPAKAYRFHKQLLQHLQWRTPSRRWVCKGVLHQFCLDTLWSVYPDAICIWTHRDPLETVPSTLGILDVLYGAMTGGQDQGGSTSAMVDGLAAGFDAVVDAPWVNDPRVEHVRFHDLIANPVAVVRDIYQRQQLAWPPGFEARMEAWRIDPANRSDRHGKFHYSLEQFGLSKESLVKRFARYRERFGVT